MRCAPDTHLSRDVHLIGVHLRAFSIWGFGLPPTLLTPTAESTCGQNSLSNVNIEPVISAALFERVHSENLRSLCCYAPQVPHLVAMRASLTASKILLSLPVAPTPLQLPHSGLLP